MACWKTNYAIACAHLDPALVQVRDLTDDLRLYRFGMGFLPHLYNISWREFLHLLGSAGQVQ